ncbi:hypothetical protein SCA6_017176 [Theobroma cacao]
MANRMSMFHGTTARGWKGVDAFYFMMNPNPAYEVTFLNKLPYELTCNAGKSSHEVANKCRALTGKDGTVRESQSFHGVLENILPH